MSENDEGEKYLAIFCSSVLLIMAAFALIGAATVCRWLSGIVR